LPLGLLSYIVVGIQTDEFSLMRIIRFTNVEIEVELEKLSQNGGVMNDYRRYKKD